MQRIVPAGDDCSEIVNYNYENYSAYIKKETLSSYPNYSADSHWHDDIEFVVILEGHMVYNVNGILIRLEKNQGIMINTCQLHYGFSDDHTECEFICVLLPPIILCAVKSIESTYITPILSDTDLPYFHLRDNVSWESVILSSIKEIYDCRNNFSAPLSIQSLFYRMWTAVYDNAFSLPKTEAPANYHLSILKDMLFYIQGNYMKKISLADIAKAGNISKNNCLKIFRKYLKTTPVTHLNNFRLQKSVNLLLCSDLIISEIAFEVGFSGASYFTEMFHKCFGCTPSEYKNINLHI